MSSRAKGHLKNVAASVHQRLYDRARTRGEDFNLTLTHYAIERLLYRLSQSRYRDRFVLKGAMLLTVWSGTPYRATRDLDLLGRGDNEVAALVTMFREICQVPVEDDGLAFVADSLRGEEIREDQEYEGVRLTLDARLGSARIPLQVDIGFGDDVKPKPEEMEYPAMLDAAAPRLLTYPREAVVAEKFQAMVFLGIGNSRMKDFFDVWFLTQRFEFSGERLCEAIKATFERRRTSLPGEPPLALTAEFSMDKAKQTQWQAFLKKAGLEGSAPPLPEVVGLLQRFLMPPVTALMDGKPFAQVWPVGGPWQDRGRGGKK